MAYDLTQIARELTATALAEAYHGNALYVVKDVPGLSAEEKAVVQRYLAGAQTGTDHCALLALANRLTGGQEKENA